MRTFKAWRARRRMMREVQDLYEAAVVEWLAELQDWRESNYGRPNESVVISFDGELGEEDVVKIRQAFADAITQEPRRI